MKPERVESTSLIGAGQHNTSNTLFDEVHKAWSVGAPARTADSQDMSGQATGLPADQQAAVGKLQKALNMPGKSGAALEWNTMLPFTTPFNRQMEMDPDRGLTPTANQIIDAATAHNPDPRAATELDFNATTDPYPKHQAVK